MAVSIVFVIWELWLRDRAAGLVADQLRSSTACRRHRRGLAAIVMVFQRSPTIS
jgi:hypothetical protein